MMLDYRIQSSKEILGSAPRRPARTCTIIWSVFLAVAGSAVRTHMEKLRDEQEILMALADAAIEIFALECAVLGSDPTQSREPHLSHTGDSDETLPSDPGLGGTSDPFRRVCRRAVVPADLRGRSVQLQPPSHDPSVGASRPEGNRELRCPPLRGPLLLRLAGRGGGTGTGRGSSNWSTTSFI